MLEGLTHACVARLAFRHSLGCSFMCKNTNIKGYPAYEITLLFLFAYGSYALAEVMKLSGIMSLFFCGITMAHYNSYNLSKPSQVTAEHIFKSFALVAEFFVFLYMGMGVCAGQFGRWDVKFIVLAIVFCLVARVFNTFPFSWLANLGCVVGDGSTSVIDTAVAIDQTAHARLPVYLVLCVAVERPRSP